MAARQLKHSRFESLFAWWFECAELVVIKPAPAPAPPPPDIVTFDVGFIAVAAAVRM